MKYASTHTSVTIVVFQVCSNNSKYIEPRYCLIYRESVLVIYKSGAVVARGARSHCGTSGNRGKAGDLLVAESAGAADRGTAAAAAAVCPLIKVAE